VYDPIEKHFAFGDKFENATAVTATNNALNLQKILIDMWAYILKNAPIK
jgi:hypothetical protein